MPEREPAEGAEESPEWPASIANAQIALSIVALGAIGAFAYGVVTPHGPHRNAIEATALGTLLGLLAVLPWSMRIAGKKLAAFVTVVTLLAGVAFACCAGLDGGTASPLAFLLVMAPMAGALALPITGIALTSAAGALELGLLALVTPNLSRSGATALVEGVVLVGAVVLTTATTRTRAWLETLNRSLLGQLDELADTDPLTGCLNERVFGVRLDAEVERSLRYEDPLSLLVADIDGFAAYNQARGHAAGDAALVDLGAHLRRLVRASDAVGRIGPDRFALLLVSTPLDPSGSEGAAQVARRVADTVAEHPALGVTVSIGIAQLDGTEPTSQRLMQDASTALQRAKLDAPGGIALSPGSGLHLVSSARPPVVRAPRVSPRPWRAGRRIPKPWSADGTDGR